MSDAVLAPGDPAPAFEAETTSGERLSLADLRGRQVVLYFYPRDNTPGCTKEACGLRDSYADFAAAGVVILGVSTDSVRSHQKFTEKFALPFALLADTDGAIARAYGAWGEKKFMGRTTIGVKRSTFVIDPEGKISHIFAKVKPEVHAQQLLDALGIARST
ncbi:thioredoxin-dependent thiol peroxidase [Gloeobacter kilaueensis]|uniref:thioredoxin-dependent peroxiredoxin n=1 Tax=Gloeobacter kilaueensis (strain ATCC BAA-2537 / CCAP 1431/1 / ULC 316 / JS1) TaxID=1183438 RepID=U5QNU0_GLOK1|nr:thioredoxin-dependent thiol peroxidase [Gloeobacter kilaueensis]AGY60667.1 bacterioferritin comigratory protein [Gloeobacter kilaueensis JS1]